MRTYARVVAAWFLPLALLGLAACGGGSSSGGEDWTPRVEEEPATPTPLEVVAVSTDWRFDVVRNEVITIEFSTEVAPESVTPAHIQILAAPHYDMMSPARGEFTVDGKLVHFRPDLPTLDDLSDAGLAEGTHYQIAFRASPPAVSSLRALHGGLLSARYESEFWTYDAPLAFYSEFFLDPWENTQIISTTPQNGDEDVDQGLNKIVLTLNRCPLQPATVIPENFILILKARDGTPYERPITGTVELEQSHESVQVEWKSNWPLERRGVYEFVIFGYHVQDLAGGALPPSVMTFSVEDGPPRSGRFTIEFDPEDRDQYADLAETTADWGVAVEDALSATGGAGDTSQGQTKWIPLPMLDLEMSDFDYMHQVNAELYNDSMSLFVQMAVDETPTDPGYVLGVPDLSDLDTEDDDGDGETDDTLDSTTLSEWTPIADITDLNGYGYQNIRIRVVFDLVPSRKPGDLLPFIDHLDLMLEY